MQTQVLALEDAQVIHLLACIIRFVIESRDSCCAGADRAWKIDGRAQALVGPGLATPLFTLQMLLKCHLATV